MYDLHLSCRGQVCLITRSVSQEKMGPYLEKESMKCCTKCGLEKSDRMALGLFNDDPEALNRAIGYLHRKENAGFSDVHWLQITPPNHTVLK